MHRILLAHADPKFVGIYKNYLSNYFKVDSAFDGLEALRLVEANKPNLVVSDYHLPLLSGAGLLKFIRNHNYLSSTPFIFLSQNHPAHDSLGLGASDWLRVQESNPDLLVAKCYNHIKAR